MISLILFTISLSFYACANAGGSSSATVQQNFLIIGNFNDCEGKNAANYTFIAQYQSDQTCTNLGPDTFDALIQCNGEQRAVNILQPLAASLYPAGAYGHFESLYLVTSGPLQGNYIYEKTIGLVKVYMKKCSSVLGYSYVTSKSAVLLISDKLDLNALLSPTGAFDAFKNSCNTVCNGANTVV